MSCYAEVKEGFLYKQGGKHKTWKHRYLIAVPGRLAYYKTKPHGLGVCLLLLLLF